MGESTDGIVLQQIQTLYRSGTIGGLSDGQLGDRVRAGRNDDDAEAAFTILAERHGPMVLRVCRQMLADRHDADDAFQATFLVLASKAHSIRSRDSLASWLHGVARRVALRTKADAARRRIHERRAATLVEPSYCEHGGAEFDADAWSALHDAIARLPERYREPVILCYLEGLSTEAASHRLGCPQGTILSRLSRARERLRKSLTRRGHAYPAVWLGAERSPNLAVAIPPAWLQAMVRASLNFAAKPTSEAASASNTVVNLARGTLYAMTIAQWKTIGAATLACVITLGGLQAFAQRGGIDSTTDQPPATKPAPDQQPALSRSVAKLQSELDEAIRRNAELAEQLQTIQADLKGLRLETPPHETKESRPPEIREKRSAQSPTANSSPNMIRLVQGPGVVALRVEGRSITRIAAARTVNGRWVTQELREPINGPAEPQLGPNVAVFRIGGHRGYIYAFSGMAERWDVLKLPEKASVSLPKGAIGSATVEGEGHFYTFDVPSGKWTDVDLNTVLDIPPPASTNDGDAGRPQDPPPARLPSQGSP